MTFIYFYFILFYRGSLLCVGTLIVRSFRRQIVGVLIVRFLEHQQRNMNLQKGRSGDGGLTTSPMIKLAKNAKKEKKIRVRIVYPP